MWWLKHEGEGHGSSGGISFIVGEVEAEEGNEMPLDFLFFFNIWLEGATLHKGKTEQALKVGKPLSHKTSYLYL